MSSSCIKAAKLYKERKYNQALGEISKLDKKHQIEENILILKGNCYDALGKKNIAKEYYKKAYEKNKQSESVLRNLAIIYFEQKKYMLSKIYINKLLQINPKNCYAITLLGNIYKEKRQYDKAIKFYQKALTIEKDFYTANMNLAGIYYMKKKYSQAYIHAKYAAEKIPQETEAIKLFAEISIELSQPDEAVLYLEKIAAKTNSDYWIYNLLSQLYMLQKKYEISIKSAIKAVEISRGENSQQINLGYILYDSVLADQNELARKYAMVWQKKYPDNPVAQYITVSVLHNKENSHNNIVYVREIFDAFANDFEDILFHLNYNVPKIMEEELSSLLKNTKLKKMRILDAGCGTGLCGYYLKKYAKFNGLDGVDISEKMLSVAKKKKVYSHLYNQDLDTFLQQHKSEYDFINAADVITYFGDLENLFQHIKICLRENGRILFSISENRIDKNNYYLHCSGRFLHSQKYIENLLNKNGFYTEKMQRAHLRNEGEEKVWGWIFMAQKTNKKTS